jgi:hypothetical protein
LRTALLAAWLLQPVSSARAQSPEDVPQTGPLSGYMELHLNKEEHRDGTLDFHRFVLLMNHSFNRRMRFVGELELEHAFVEGLEEAGEVELEQAYVDFLISRAFNLRAGMMLMPLGIINERHEPPVFHGVERPFVDTVIIPTTWFDAGAGIHGELGPGLRYRAFVMAPLNALEFNAEEGLRGGRQKGSESNVRNVAATGRIEYVAAGGLTLGASAWSGDTSFAAPRLKTTTRIVEADARYKRGQLELRGQFAGVSIANAGALNENVQRLTGISPNVAAGLRGFYGEAAYRVWNAGAPRDLVAFVRYENFDTQHRMPEGHFPLKQFDRDAVVMGVTYFPDPDIAVKFDVVRMRNQSQVIPAANGVNVGLGWWF